MFIFLFAILLACNIFALSQQQPTVYATPSSDENLVARISCEVDETQHFHYSSATSLWGAMGGEIQLKADVALHCLGDDKGGKYESEALKYLVEVSNLVLEQKRNGPETSSRQKRQVRDYFSSAWKRIKRFFKKMFGGSSEEIEERPVVKDEVRRPEDRKETSSEEEEVFNLSELTELYSVPFQFVQLANGSIPEIRFTESDKDGRVKNFKRHLVDAFATQLNKNDRRKPVVENSVMGEHISVYNVTLGEHSNLPLLALAGMSIGHSSSPERGSDTVLVEKLVTENDILKLAPKDDNNEALNDKDKITLKMKQTQLFKDGKMMTSSGTSSLTILHDSNNKEKRSKRSTDEDDIMSYFQATSQFNMQLKRRQKRSLMDEVNVERLRATKFVSSSRSAEVEDDSAKQSLRELQDSIQNATIFFRSLLEEDGPDYNEKMQLLFEMVEREVGLKLDKESHSVSRAARRTLSKQVMQNMCSQNFTKCKDFLQLLALAGGDEAEDVLLSFFNTNQLPDSNIRSIADIISDTSDPSTEFISSLSSIIKQSSKDSPEFFGALVLSTGYLASKGDDGIKIIVANSLMYALSDHEDNCRSDPVVLDVLEAIGNLGDDSTVSGVLKVSAKCKDERDVQIASAHALRHSTNVREVRRWMQSAVAAGNCDLTRAVIGALLDRIGEQEMNHDESSWPLHKFNTLDSTLLDQLDNHTSDRFPCNEEDVLLYFSRKKDPRAHEITRTHFGTDSEPWNPESKTRQKRALWDNLNCQEWTEDNKYNPIQDKEEFAADRATYNKRKSCLAYRRLGVKGANAEIYAGMFAGVKEPSEPPKYKLFTKFVSGINFLGRQMEIGSFYFYLQSGKTKAYVRILDRTRQEYTQDGCTPTDLKYRPIKQIPLYLLSVSAVQVSLGIHLSSQLGLDTTCPGNAYKLEPMASVRIGGEATGTVLFARGTVNLAGNFNYKLQFTFTPTPNICLNGSHGYDPMKISFETYYQMWNKLKDDWGKFRTWKPSFLSWQLRRGAHKSWFDDTCIIKDSSSRSQYSEIESEEE